MNTSNQGKAPCSCQAGQDQDMFKDTLSQNLAAHSNGNVLLGPLAQDALLSGVGGGPYSTAGTMGMQPAQRTVQSGAQPSGTMGTAGAVGVQQGFPFDGGMQPGPTSAGAQQGTIPQNLMPITPLTEPMPQTMQNVMFLNAALRTQIGKRITVSFLIGTNTFVYRTGTLLSVGANYILLLETDTDDLVFCDFFTIKFVRIYR